MINQSTVAPSDKPSMPVCLAGDKTADATIFAQAMAHSVLYCRLMAGYMLAWRIINSSAGSKQPSLQLTSPLRSLTLVTRPPDDDVLAGALLCGSLRSCYLLQLLQFLLIGDCLQTTQPQSGSPTCHSKAFQKAVM